MSPIIGILVGLLLVLLNGFFVAIEFALARISKPKLENKIKNNDDKSNKTTMLIISAIDNIEKYISSAQVGITIASLALGAIGELTVAKLIHPIIHSLAPEYSSIAAHSISLPIALLIITYFHVVVGEIIPKAFAFIKPEQTAYALIWPLEIFTIFASPLVTILNASASYMMKPFGVRDFKTPFFYTEDELKLLVNLSQEEGVIEESEKEMITNIFDFPDTIAREIMTPRTDMHCLENTTTIEDAVKYVLEANHSRFPVYEDSIDNVIGYLTTKDLLNEVHSGNYKKSVSEIIKPIIKVPESIPIDDLLTDLRKKSLQLAIIIDEFGGTSGIVTVEDIVEEIVGEIHDEYDVVEEDPIQILENGEVLVDGKANIDEVNEQLGTNFSYEHYDTIGGLTFGLIGKEPVAGDEVETNGYTIRVEEKDDEKERIKQVRLIKTPIAEKESENGNNTNVSTEAPENNELKS